MAQSSAVGQPVRVPLAANVRARDGFRSRGGANRLVIDQQLINCYAEFNPETKEFNVQKRPGYSASIFSPPSAVGQGLFQFVPDVGGGGTPTNTDSFVAVSNGKAYMVFDIDILGPTSTTYELGDVDTTGGVYRGIVMPFADLSEARVLVIGNGVKAYYTAGITGDLVEITDPQFPSAFYKGWAYLNSRLYVGKPRNVLQGAENLNDPDAWETLNIILAQDESDNGVAIAKHSSFIVFFKETSTEFFFDNGNLVGSALLPSPQNSYDIGCFDANSIRDIDGTLLWVTSSKQRVPQVARMDATQYTIISTPEIEKILLRGGTFKAIVMKITGHRFYILTCSTFVTLVYDLDQELWYVWEGSPLVDSTLIWPISDCITTAPSSSNEIFTVLQDSRTGKIYLAGADYVFNTDDTYTFPVDIYTSNFDAGVDRKKNVNMMYFDTDLVKGSEIQVRTNDYDFSPDKWTPFRTVDLGVEKPQLANCGSFYRRAHHIRHQKACPFIIRGVGLQTDVGVA